MASEMPMAAWRSSSFSGGNGECLELSILYSGHVTVRDSKSAERTLTFRDVAWGDFLGYIRRPPTEDDRT